jgi:hypothetical protein
MQTQFCQDLGNTMIILRTILRKLVMRVGMIVQDRLQYWIFAVVVNLPVLLPESLILFPPVN